MSKQLKILALVLGLLPLCATIGAELPDREWLEVQTQNFSISSVIGDKQTVELARHLEAFRVAVVLLTNVTTTIEDIPTRIVVVDSSTDMKYLGNDDRGVVGFFLPGMRENTIVVRDTLGREETAIILHEYVHFLLRNRSAFHYPRWYDEGLAEFLSGIRFREDSFEVGRVPKGYRDALINLTWIPIRRVIAPENYEKWPSRSQYMFYIEAWALYQYLFNRQDESSADSAEELGEYLRLMESGIEDLAAFEQAFGISAANLNREIQNFLTRGRFRYYELPVSALLPEFEFDVRLISREQISLELGQIAMRMGELERADSLFEAAQNAKETRSRALAGRGDVRKFRGEYEAALPYFIEALEASPDDPYCQLDMAEYWHDLAIDTEDAEAQSELLSKARTHYVAAWKLDNDAPEVYAMYGQSYLVDGSSYEKATEMLEEARYLLPSSIDIRLWLAEAYAGSGQLESAAEEARYVMTWAHGDSGYSQQATELLDALTQDKE